MITKLIMKNYCFIDKLEIDFKNGFTLIVGESGSGKSLIVNAIGFLLGKKAKPAIVKMNSQYAYFYGRFSEVTNEVEVFLSANKIDFLDHEVIISRKVFNNKNIISINGRQVSLCLLQKLALLLGDFNNQNIGLELFQKKNYLDFFKSKELDEELNNYKKLLVSYNETINNFELVHQTYEKTKLDIDYFKFVYNELITADLKVQEFSKLEKEILKMNGCQKINELISSISKLIDSNFINNFYEILTLLEKISIKDESFITISSDLHNCYDLFTDLSKKIQKSLVDNDFDLEKFNFLNERLSLITMLEKKHHLNFDSLLNYREELREKIENFDSFNHSMKDFDVLLKSLLEQLKASAKKISDYRKSIALKLEKELLDTLKCLRLPSATFKVDIHPSANFGTKGCDDVEFLVSFNQNVPPKPLINIASGGEQQRFLFAIKVNLLKNTNKNIVIFDEIDSGISGDIARSVAQFEHALSKNKQVIAVTHQFMVTEEADNVLFIEKINQNSPKIVCRYLDEQQKFDFIAKMILPNLSLDKRQKIVKILQKK